MFPIICALPEGSRCFREHLENYSAHFIGVRAADGRAGRKETGEARTADREDGRKLETRRRQEQKSIKRAAKLVRLNGCLCIFC